MLSTKERILQMLEGVKAHERTCPITGRQFTVREEDLAFYGRVLTPPPTLCPDARMQRRLSWRNERKLYKRQCDATGKSIIALYHPESAYKVYSAEYFWSDHWDPREYGVDYNPDKPFFEQLRALQLRVPRLALLNMSHENSDYANHAAENKDSYFVFASFVNENAMYSRKLFHSKDVLDTNTALDHCEKCYECYHIFKSYNLRYCDYAINCTDSAFLYDCTGCSNCYMCVGLQNASYHYKNQPVSKEEFEALMAGLAKYSVVQEQSALFETFKKEAGARTIININSEGSTGNELMNCTDCHDSFDLEYCERCNYCCTMEYAKDSYDVYGAGMPAELIYEVHGMKGGYMSKFCHASYESKFSEYCDSCYQSENLFGCVSMKKSQFCILNKQYTEEEYYALRERIIHDMLDRKEYGEFFPSANSPFGYDESFAMQIFPLNKDQIEARRWRWSGYDTDAQYEGEMLTPEDDIQAYRDETAAKKLLGSILRCEKSDRPFRIIPQELAFYLKNNIPIPHEHPDTRNTRRTQKGKYSVN